MPSPSTTYPSVGVVIPTRDRAELLRRALASVARQTYPGRIETVVVHDGTPVDETVHRDDARPVHAVANTRTPGLAGARNTGILALATDYVAFCDDDDHWEPTKLARQIERATRPDRPEMITCAMLVDFDGHRTPRLAGTAEVTHARLTRSIMAMLHSSGMLFDRSALLDMGLVNEDIPGSQNEDWDIKLRAASRRPIAHVDEPLITVQWGRSSMFARAWETKNQSFVWMLENHPQISADAHGASRVYGQLAFGEAALGERRSSMRWAGRALRANPLQWRAVAALPVAAGIVRPEQVLNTLHRFGRGV
ncbi:glycosyltransferase family 2 protein [Nocardioides sp. URHA0020]|uniref:glycosyltransferase family 2 protein n=1 Tax=Nocardioides sp. URHA0020 TaxID=1380392 RepID=UPI000566BFE3|nr:glycosyltransferase family A protein [Nocardioides sp. URHA0020]